MWSCRARRSFYIGDVYLSTVSMRRALRSTWRVSRSSRVAILWPSSKSCCIKLNEEEGHHIDLKDKEEPIEVVIEAETAEEEGKLRKLGAA
jgi:hypothetical protein